MAMNFTPLVFTSPMQPFLAGFLLASVLQKGGDCMNIVEAIPADVPTGFEVLFASGLRVAVRVEVLEPERVQ
ncbi:hypothetical protein [Sphingomonas sp.]|uniref:hypothetical protein n=1 Tax=Sphingomonas sp. TaxID=28214 RepID=UPI0025EE5F31|nr:hypothetical protein [Sphingomonas sp.]